MNVLLDSFQTGFSALPLSLIDAQGLGDWRRSCLARSLIDGLPGACSERWKYTSLRALSARSFLVEASTPQLHPAALDDIPTPRLVLVNGKFEPRLSSFENLPGGICVQTLSSALSEGEARAVDFLAGKFHSTDEVFSRLNAAFALEGALVRVAADSKIELPLHLVFVGAPADGDLATHNRHLIELGENASLTLIEYHLAAGSHRHLSNHFSHVDLKHGAKLVHARLQDEAGGATAIARTDAVLASNADYRRVDMELGAAMSRHELNVSLQGQKAHFVSGGILLAGGRCHVDTRLGIEHVARDTACDLLWRGLAAERGRVVFHGGICIRAGADGTSATLSNKNLLLSDAAEIDAQPVLEIYADEVKAAHGATVGHLDADHLFYLRSRGIAQAQARALLTLAFCREALARLDNAELIEQLAQKLQLRLAALETAA